MAAGAEAEPWELSALALRAALLRGGLTPVEAVERALRRIDDHDPQLRAFITVAHDAARQRAAELQELDAEARRALPLYGVPVAVKDELWTAGIRTTAGSRAFADFVPQRDATAVARLRAAGAVIVGKTNTAELGMSIRSRNAFVEECRNPHDPARTAGGSSGGSAASVAAGLVPLALARDAGGSIRVPAALCGAVGLYPTVGLIPNDGDLSCSTHFASAGPIARTVADAAVALHALTGRSGPPLGAGEDRAQPVRVGWWETPVAGPPPHPAVLELVRRAVDRLDGALWRVEPVAPPFDGVAEDFRTISDVDRAATCAPHLGRGARALLRPETRARLARGSRTSGVAYARALGRRHAVQQAVAQLFRRVELLVSPAIGVVAPPLLAADADALDDPLSPLTFGFAGVANYLGCCAIALPCGTVDGLPVAVQLLAPGHAEVGLLEIACAAERHWTADASHAIM